jgi:hypothetical protein
MMMIAHLPGVLEYCNKKTPVSCQGFIAFILVSSHKRVKTIHNSIVKVEEVFWETRKKGFLNVAVFTLWMFL